MSERRPKATCIFYSYSHKDEDLRGELEAHLASLRRSGIISEWHDRKLAPGDDWDKVINSHLESADIILFLLSSDFINSTYISDVEVKLALRKQLAGQAVVVPVILRPVLWRIIPEFSRLQALPEHARPVTEWLSHDLAFVSVCEGILALILSKHSGASAKAAVSNEDTQLRPRSTSRIRRRMVDAALPARVPLSKPSTLLVMIRMLDSPGLRAIVEADPSLDITSDDISGQSLPLRFPSDATGRPQPLELNVKVESPQFDPPSQVKNILVPPRGDSKPRVFLLAAKERGPLRINVEVCRGNEVVAGFVLQTLGKEPYGDAASHQGVTSASLEMSDAEEQTILTNGGNAINTQGADQSEELLERVHSQQNPDQKSSWHLMTIEFSPEYQKEILALAAAHPEYVKQVSSRHSIGGGGDFTFLISLAGLAMPAIKDVLVAHIRAGQYKYVSYKNLKIRGHSPEDIEKILVSMRDSGLKL